MKAPDRLAGAVHVEERGPVVVVSLAGEIDLVCVPDLLAAAEHVRSLPAAALRNALVVDLSATTFLGLVGIEFVERIERYSADEGGGLVVVGGSPQVRRLLRLVGLDRLFLEPLPTSVALR